MLIGEEQIEKNIGPIFAMFSDQRQDALFKGDDFDGIDNLFKMVSSWISCLTVSVFSVRVKLAFEKDVDLQILRFADFFAFEARRSAWI